MSTGFRTSRAAWLALAASLVVGLAFGAAGAGARSGHSLSGITVFAGSSMTDVLPGIDAGNTYSFGSSNTLANQISNGAPADVFMSANTTTPAALYAAGKVEKPIEFTRNTLAVVVPKSNPAGVHSIYDLTKPGIKIDIAATTVPVGVYTVQVLNQMGLNTAIQANVVSQETSDSSVVTKVATGQVDAGFVYTSDYVIDPTDLILIKVPAWAQPKITYSLAIVTASPNQAAAQAWVKRVLSPVGQLVFVRSGFLPLTAPVPTVATVSRLSAKPGATLSVRGTNLDSTTAVTFRGVPAAFKVLGPFRLSVVVPERARSGSITVTNPAGTATSPRTFTVR